MKPIVSTLDALVSSVTDSFIRINQSLEKLEKPGMNAVSRDAFSRPDMFQTEGSFKYEPLPSIAPDASGDADHTFSLSLFERPMFLGLQTLTLRVPVHIIRYRERFFKPAHLAVALQPAGFWRRLFRVHAPYEAVIDIHEGQVKLSFQLLSTQATRAMLKNRADHPAENRIFTLSPEQILQVQALQASVPFSYWWQRRLNRLVSWFKRAS